MEKLYVVTKKGIQSKDVGCTEDIIRKISTKEALEELVERMPYIQTIQASNAKSRKELYELSMSEYDDLEWVKVIKSVYLRMEDHHYEDFEPEYAERAKHFLYGEFSIRFNIHFEEVESFLNKIIEKQLEEF